MDFFLGNCFDFRLLVILRRGVGGRWRCNLLLLHSLNFLEKSNSASATVSLGLSFFSLRVRRRFWIVSSASSFCWCQVKRVVPGVVRYPLFPSSNLARAFVSCKYWHVALHHDCLAAPTCDYREFRPYVNQHPYATLIADLVDHTGFVVGKHIGV